MNYCSVPRLSTREAVDKYFDTKSKLRFEVAKMVALAEGGNLEISQLQQVFSGAFDYDGIVTDGGEVSHYQCSKCGKSLCDKESDCVVNDPEELAEWLKENCPQEDKNPIDDNSDKFEN